MRTQSAPLPLNRKSKDIAPLMKSPSIDEYYITVASISEARFLMVPSPILFTNARSMIRYDRHEPQFQFRRSGRGNF